MIAAVVYFTRRRSHTGGDAVLRAKPSRLAHDPTTCAVWRFAIRFLNLPPGKTLRVEVSAPAIVRWTTNQWDSAHDTRTVAMDGIHIADLPTGELPTGTRVQFTFYWPEARRWEGEDFDVRVQQGARYGGSASD
jgi:hypothetical protein